jgi:hypothetical protein
MVSLVSAANKSGGTRRRNISWDADIDALAEELARDRIAYPSGVSGLLTALVLDERRRQESKEAKEITRLISNKKAPPINPEVLPLKRASR